MDLETRKLVDGPKQQYRCYAATLEAAFPSVLKAHYANWELLKEAGKRPDGIKELLMRSIPQKAVVIRIHASGDFYSYNYLAAWMFAVEQHDHIKFYAYTKSHALWHRWLVEEGNELPRNMALTLSDGSKFDELIARIKLRDSSIPTAVTVFHPDDADARGLRIDKSDALALQQTGEDFALLLHGAQPAKSKASAAVRRMRQEGVKYAYSTK